MSVGVRAMRVCTPCGYVHTVSSVRNVCTSVGVCLCGMVCASVSVGVLVVCMFALTVSVAGLDTDAQH